MHTFDKDFPAFELLEVAHADAFLEEHLGKISPLADGVQTTQVGLVSQHPTGKSRPSATDLQMSQFDAFPASRFYSVNKNAPFTDLLHAFNFGILVFELLNHVGHSLELVRLMIIRSSSDQLSPVLLNPEISTILFR